MCAKEQNEDIQRAYSHLPNIKNLDEKFVKASTRQMLSWVLTVTESTLGKDDFT